MCVCSQRKLHTAAHLLALRCEYLSGQNSRVCHPSVYSDRERGRGVRYIVFLEICAPECDYASCYGILHRGLLSCVSLVRFINSRSWPCSVDCASSFVSYPGCGDGFGRRRDEGEAWSW